MTRAELEVVPPPTEPPDEHEPGPTGTVLANVDAERAVLGALLHGDRLDHRDALTADDFWRPPHQTIYAAIRALADRGDPHDAIAIGEHLARTEQLQRAGGFPYLHTLMATATAAGGTIGYHAELIVEVAVRRRLQEAAVRVRQLAEHPGGDPVVDVVERARAALDDVARAVETHDEHAGRGVDLDELIGARSLAYEQPHAPGLRTGWADLDELLGGGAGLRGGQLIVVGARVGVGKSLIGVNLAVAAARAGVRAALFSLEMTREEIADRVIASAGGIDLSRLIAHQLTEWDWGRLRQARADLAGAPMHVDDRPGLTLAAIRAKCRDLTRQQPRLGLVVVDYAQLIVPADPRVDRRVQVDAISRGLKLLAKELDVPVVAMAQVNRGPEARADKTPTLADLRESGALEQDADGVWLAYRTDHPGELHISVAKNRNGPAGRTVALAWMPQHARLANLDRGFDRGPDLDGRGW